MGGLPSPIKRDNLDHGTCVFSISETEKSFSTCKFALCVLWFFKRSWGGVDIEADCVGEIETLASVFVVVKRRFLL